MLHLLRKPWTLLFLVVVVVVIAAASIALHIPDPDIAPSLAQRSPDIAHGEYIATVGDCGACHTRPGGQTLAGGLGFATPIGTIYSTNITPDPNAGIGNYSFKDFVRVVRYGVRPNGSRLYPAMPYTDYAKVSDEDLQDLFAYLHERVAPVSEVARANEVPWPLSMRWPMAFWDLAFLNTSRFVADPAKSAQWNRGAYIVEGLEHCGECHTPRLITESLDNARKFSGAVTQGWKAYNITASEQSGVGRWTDEALASYLSTGHAMGHSSASGPMAEAVEKSLRHLTSDDIQAVVAYLRSIPAIDSVPAIASNPPALMDTNPPSGLGEQVFAGNCANCHDWDGRGVQSPYASLVGSRTVNDPDATNLIAILLSGSNTSMPVQHTFMPPFARGHTDDELAAVANFVTGYFGNGSSHVTAADIDKGRKALP
jgi:mono/diheme cytochrome c family protein